MGEISAISFEDAPFEIIDGDRGINYPKQHEFSNMGYCLFLNAKNVTYGGFDLTECLFITKEKDEALRKGKLQPEDIVLTTRGTVGNVAYFSNQIPYENIRINSGMVILRPDQSKILPPFFYYYLKSSYFHEQVNSFRSGVAQPQLPICDMKRMKILIPSLLIQNKIAAILSAYDDLIENNLRRIKILEEMAQNLYREWFVNFRFPGHEQTRFVDSPLGRIPEGWEVKRLGDIANIDKGLSYKGIFLTEEGDPMVNLKCIMPGGGYNRSGTKPYSGQYKPKQKVNSGDLVFANTDITQAGNVIGTPAIVPGEGFCSGGLASHHISIVRLNENCPFKQVFLYYLLLHGGFRDYAKSCASGTTVLGFRSSDALDYKFVMPPINLVENYELFVQNIYYMYEILMDKNATLRQTRDLLLPKLISGEVDVSELDIKVPEEVAI